MARTRLGRDQINDDFPVVIAATYQNGWIDYDSTEYNSAGYYKDAMGIVHLRGLIKNGSLGVPAFTLPVGMRPIKRCIFIVQSAGNNTLMRVDVLANGQVQPQAGGSGGNAWVSLEGIHFIAGA